MKIKTRMIGFDLDGTLLTTEKELTKRTKDAMERAIAQGIELLPATGRTLCGIPREVLEFPGIRYALTANGGRIVEVKTGKTILERLVMPDTARKVLTILEKYDTMCELYYDGQGYALEEKLASIEQYLPEAPMARYVKATRKGVSDLWKLFEEENRAMDKLQGLFVNYEDKLAAIEELKEVPGIEVTGALNNNIEVNAAGVNKGAALVELGASMGIAREEIMAFGDGANDIHLMREVGSGVAMSNAIEAVKKAADYIAGSNDEDGVAEFLETYVLDRKS